MSEMVERAVADAYTKERNEILAAIRAGRVSATLSGIEYYPGEWGGFRQAKNGRRSKCGEPKNER